MDTLRAFLALIGPRRRAQLLLTLVVMLAGAAAELLTIGATVPFLALLSGGGSGAPAHVPDWLSLQDWPFRLVALLLVASAIGAAAIRLLLVWMTQRFVAALGHDLATAIFARMLRQPYADFVRRNSSEVLASVEKVRDIVNSVIQPVMQGLIATVLGAAIVVLLLSIDAAAAGAAAAAVSAVYIVVSVATRPRLRRNSMILAESMVSRTKILQEGLGGMRDIVIEQSQPVFEAKFRQIDSRFRRALAANQIISATPRFVVEAAGIVAIALIAVGMSTQPGGLVKAIPVLGALALGAQRLLPMLQQIYTGWSVVIGNFQAVRDVQALLAAPVRETRAPGGDPLPFEREIAFERVSFRYAGGPFALRDVDAVFPRGSRIGIVGPTGGGKSTLLDLLMGLLDPSEGEIRIDGRRLDDETRTAWQAQLAHVPQAIYLADDSIAANIAFGAAPETIDGERVREAARAARLDSFVAELDQGYDTRVGERGIRLSGGQRQRIGVARALYRRASVLILDEATSALDDETEAEVIDSVMSLGSGITVIMIAHRRSTLVGCDRLFRVEKGSVREVDPAELGSPSRRRSSAA